MNQTAESAAGIPQEARKWATICHLSALVGLMGNGIGLVLGPLIVWLIKRDEHPFIDQQGKEALNFQITMFIAVLASIPLIFILIGILTMVMAFSLMIIMPIVAAIKANDGEAYRYPLTLRLVK